VVRFDPQTEQIKDDPQAAKMIHREYRPGHWAVPKGV
jgi:hypothetical protein